MHYLIMDYQWVNEPHLIQIKMIPLKSSRRLIHSRQFLPNLMHRPKVFFTRILKCLGRRMNADLQKAIISYYMISYIIENQKSSYLGDKSTIRERLLNRQQFNNYIIKKCRQKMKYQAQKQTDDKVNHQWLNRELQMSNYNQVTKCFLVWKGAKFNPQIWMQKGYIGNAKNSRQNMTFYPTTITHSYFREIITHKNVLLSGYTGIGKSFSFVIYDYFSNFMHKCRYTQSKLINQNLLVSLDGLRNYPRLCYIFAMMTDQFICYFYQISSQFFDIFPKEQFKAEWLQIYESQLSQTCLIQYLVELKKRISLNNLKITAVIDEFTHVLSKFRALKDYVFEKKQQFDRKKIEYNSNDIRKVMKQSHYYKTILFYTKIIKIFACNSPTKFQTVIFNSSENYGFQQAKSLGKLVQQQFQLIKIIEQLTKNPDQNQPRQRAYHLSSQITSNQIHISIYNYLWFEILRYIQGKHKDSLGGHRQTQLYKDYKLIFWEAFKVPNLQDIQPQPNFGYEKWKIDVNHFEIRLFFEHQEFQNMSKTFKCLQVQNVVSQNSNISSQIKTKFMQQLRLIKQAIQMIKIDDTYLNIKKYFSALKKCSDYQAKVNHIKILYSQASAFIDNKYTGAIYLYHINGASKEEKYNLVSVLGFGYYDRKLLIDGCQKDVIRCIVRPQVIKDIIQRSQMTVQYEVIQIMMKIDSLKANNQLTVSESRKILDTIRFLMYKIPFFDIFFHYKDHKGKKKYPIYRLLKSERFGGFTQFQNEQNCQHNKSILSEKNSLFMTQDRLAKIFDKLIKETPTDSHYLCCIPVIQQMENSTKKVKDFSNNQKLFDIILLQKAKQGSQLRLIFINWVNGEMKNKDRKQIQADLAKIIRSIDYKGQIICQFYFVAQKQKQKFIQKKVRRLRLFRPIKVVRNNGEICKIVMRIGKFNETPFICGDGNNKKLIQLMEELHRSERENQSIARTRQTIEQSQNEKIQNTI